MLEFHCAGRVPLSMSNLCAISWTLLIIAFSPISWHPTAWNYWLPNLQLLPEIWSLSLCAGFLCADSFCRWYWYPNRLSYRMTCWSAIHSKMTFVTGVLNLIHSLVAEGLWNADIVCNILCLSINNFFFFWERSRGFCFVLFSSESIIQKYLKPLLLTNAKQKRRVIYVLYSWLNFSKEKYVPRINVSHAH